MDEREKTIRRQSVASGLIAIAAVQRPWPVAIALISLGTGGLLLWPGWASAVALATAWLGGSIAGIATTRLRAMAVTFAVAANAATITTLLQPPQASWERGSLACAAILLALLAASRVLDLAPRASPVLAIAFLVAGGWILLGSPTFPSWTQHQILRAALAVSTIGTLLVAPRVRVRWLAVTLFAGGALLLESGENWMIFLATPFWEPVFRALAVSIAGGAAARLALARETSQDDVTAAWARGAAWRPFVVAGVVLTSWSMLLIQVAGIWGKDEMDVLRTVVLTALATHAVRPARFGAETFAPLVFGLALGWLTVNEDGYLGVAHGNEALRGAAFAAVAFAWCRFAPDAAWTRRAGFVALLLLFALPLAARVRTSNVVGWAWYASFPVALTALMRSEIRTGHAVAIAAALAAAQRLLDFDPLGPDRFDAEIPGALAAAAVAAAIVILACGVRRAQWMCVIPEDHPVYTDMKKA